jgi:hypothetical protein
MTVCDAIGGLTSGAIAAPTALEFLTGRFTTSLFASNAAAVFVFTAEALVYPARPTGLLIAVVTFLPAMEPSAG